MYKQSLPLNNFSMQTSVIDYECFLCKGILNKPVIDSCGHTFCYFCYHQYLLTNNLCPISSRVLPQKPVHVTLIENIINNQFIKCNNNALGCEWQGRVSELNQHLSEDCMNQTIYCIFSGCRVQFLREFLDEHLYICDYRESKCVHCQMLMPFISLKNHDLICLKKLLCCPLKCGNQIQRESMKMHIEGECENKQVKCPYLSIGCCGHFTLKTLSLHLNSHQGYHCDLVFELYKKCKLDQDASFNSLNEKIAQVEQDVNIEKERKRDALVQEAASMINITGSIKNKKNKLKKPLFVLNKGIDNKPKINMRHLSSEIEVNGSVIQCKLGNLTDHKYVFFNMLKSDYERNEIKWSIKLLNNSNWIAFGLCVKSKVLENNMLFYSPKPNFEHYSFAISSNGFLWNSNAKHENNMIGGFHAISKDDVVHFSYIINKHELKFKIKDYIGKLTNVNSIDEGEHLTPCIIFLNSGDRVQVDLY